MATLIVRHEVDDFGTWKRAYDEFDAERRGMGVTGHAVYRSEGHPNDVTVLHDFDTLEDARAFAMSPRLVEVMRAAGVRGEPEIWFGSRVE